MKNIHFFKKFIHFLLIGLSSLVLFAGVQSGMVGDFTQKGPDQVLADENDCATNPAVLGCPNPGEVIGEEPLPVAPPPAAPVCSGPEFKYNQCVACNESEPVYQNSCGEYSTGPRQFDAACASWCASTPPPPPTNQCTPNDQIDTKQECVGQQLCTFNRWQGSDCSFGWGGAYGCHNSAQCGFQQPVSQPQPHPQPQPQPQPAPVCNSTTNQEFSCIGQQYCTYNVVRDCYGNLISRNQISCQYAAGQCGGSPFPICTPSSCNAPSPSCGQTTQGVDNCGNNCFRRGQACPLPAPVTPPVVSAPAPITINPAPITINTPPITVSNPSAPITISVTSPAGQGAVTTREVVREVQTFGNVGVGTTAVQIAAVKELPKTGLPLLAWGALAFIPAGFRIRRFSKVKEEVANKPHFLWEERQFKV